MTLEDTDYHCGVCGKIFPRMGTVRFSHDGDGMHCDHGLCPTCQKSYSLHWPDPNDCPDRPIRFVESVTTRDIRTCSCPKCIREWNRQGRELLQYLRGLKEDAQIEAMSKSMENPDEVLTPNDVLMGVGDISNAEYSELPDLFSVEDMD